MRTASIVALALLGAGCGGDEERQPPPTGGEGESEAESEAQGESEAEGEGEPAAVTVTLVVDGMDCPKCSQRAEIALERLDGVVEAAVTLSPPEAVVTYFSDRVTLDDMCEALQDIGFDSNVASP
jgi:copper chaperone CopZ